MHNVYIQNKCFFFFLPRTVFKRAKVIPFPKTIFSDAQMLHQQQSQN